MKSMLTLMTLALFAQAPVFAKDHKGTHCACESSKCECDQTCECEKGKECKGGHCDVKKK